MITGETHDLLEKKEFKKRQKSRKTRMTISWGRKEGELKKKTTSNQQVETQDLKLPQRPKVMNLRSATKPKKVKGFWTRRLLKGGGKGEKQGVLTQDTVERQKKDRSNNNDISDGDKDRQGGKS